MARTSSSQGGTIRTRGALTVVAIGAALLLNCGRANGSGEASVIRDKLVATGLSCGEDSIGKGSMADGSDPFDTVECYSAKGWYEVLVWASADGLRAWWAARCVNQSSDLGSRAVGSNWTTDIQTRQEAQVIADALGGKVKTTADWCAAPAEIGGS